MLYKDIIVEAIKAYKHNRTLGDAAESFVYPGIFIIFNFIFIRLVWRRPLKKISETGKASREQ